MHYSLTTGKAYLSGVRFFARWSARNGQMLHPRHFGMLLFVTNALTGIPLKDMVREGWSFTALLVLALLLMTLFPQIVLWLPQTMGYVTH